MHNNECIQHDCHCDCHTTSRISWSAIIAGAILAVGLSFLFHLLTVGIGLSSVTRTEKGIEILVISILAWSFVGSYIIYFISGWVAGDIARPHCASPWKGMFYGFLVWALALLISTIFMTQITGLTSSVLKTSVVRVETASAVSVNAPAARKAYNPHNPSNPNVINEEAKEVAEGTGIASLAAFVLFLAGALGGTFGGYYGLKYYRKGDINHK